MPRIGFHHSHFNRSKINSKTTNMTMQMITHTWNSICEFSNVYWTRHEWSLQHFPLLGKSATLNQHSTNIAQNAKIVQPRPLFATCPLGVMPSNYSHRLWFICEPLPHSGRRGTASDECSQQGVSPSKANMPECEVHIKSYNWVLQADTTLSRSQPDRQSPLFTVDLVESLKTFPRTGGWGRLRFDTS